MAKHGLFGKPDRRGWFDYEKCPACGDHYWQCTCGREKSGLEEKLEVASQADIITSIGAMTGIPPGCLLLLCIMASALMVVILGED